MSDLNPHTSATTTFFSTPDTVYYLMNIMDFTTLTIYASLNHCCRRLVKRLFRTRLYSLLTPYFIGKTDVDALLYLLGDSRGAIFGSVALAVITPANDRDWVPNNLNLIAVGKRAGCLLDMFEDMDYSFVGPLSPRNFGTKRYWVGTKWESSCVRSVTISQSTDRTIFPPIFGCDTTSKMNFITQMGIFCPYPQLTSCAQALSIGTVPEEGEVYGHASRSISLLPNTSSLTHACGFECPKGWRRLRGGRGICKFNWLYADEVSNLDVFLESFEYMWRLGDFCTNPNCAMASIS